MNINISLPTSSIETVTKNIITKLYDLAFNAGENDTIEYQGNLYSATAYNKEVEWLQLNFPNLIINVPLTGLYIKFEDPEVERVLLENNIGDGVGVTLAVAANATFDYIFQGNTTITKFPEFKYFTKENNNPTTSSAQKGVFAGCSNLTEIDLSNVTKLGKWLFMNSGLTLDINIPNLMAVDGDQQFANTKIVNVISLGHLPAICHYMFMYCKNLQTVNLPEECTEIRLRGFRESTVKTINGINHVQIFGESSFRGCSNLNLTTEDLENAVTIELEAFWYVPISEINCKNLTGTLGANAFRENSSLTKVECLGKVNTIGSNVFYKDNNLTEVYLPYECTTLNNGAFLNCTKLSKVKQYKKSVDEWVDGENPEYGPLFKVTYFDISLFYGCQSLRLTIDDISNVQTFRGHRDTGPFGKSLNNQILDVQDLNLPNCTAIGDIAFYGMTSIKTINLPNLTTLNGNGTFAYCTNLEEVTSLGNVITIGGDFNYGGIGMFLGCTKLRKVVLPSNLISISYNMFSSCSLLSDINIPTTITKVGNGAFEELVSLRKPLYFPNVAGDLPCYIGGSTYDIYFPKANKTMPPKNEAWNGNPNASHFSYRGNLVTKKLIYLKDITSFGVYTFFHTSINTLIINNVTPPTIELVTYTNIVNLANYPSASTDIFYGSTISNIYVPDSAVDTYKNNSLYSSLASKIKPLSECPRVTVAQAEAGEVGLVEEYIS